MSVEEKPCPAGMVSSEMLELNLLRAAATGDLAGAKAALAAGAPTTAKAAVRREAELHCIARAAATVLFAAAGGAEGHSARRGGATRASVAQARRRSRCVASRRVLARSFALQCVHGSSKGGL
jgi:hypothetical protein